MANDLNARLATGSRDTCHGRVEPLSCLSQEVLLRPAKETVSLQALTKIGERLQGSGPSCGDWEMVAEDLGYPRDDIDSFRHLADAQKVCPGVLMLKDWSSLTHGRSVLILREALLSCQRTDCVTVLEQAVRERLWMPLNVKLIDEGGRVTVQQFRTLCEASLKDSLENCFDIDSYNIVEAYLSWEGTKAKELRGKHLSLKRKSIYQHSRQAVDEEILPPFAPFSTRSQTEQCVPDSTTTPDVPLSTRLNIPCVPESTQIKVPHHAHVGKLPYEHSMSSPSLQQNHQNTDSYGTSLPHCKTCTCSDGQHNAGKQDNRSPTSCTSFSPSHRIQQAESVPHLTKESTCSSTSVKAMQAPADPDFKADAPVLPPKKRSSTGVFLERLYHSPNSPTQQTVLVSSGAQTRASRPIPMVQVDISDNNFNFIHRQPSSLSTVSDSVESRHANSEQNCLNVPSPCASMNISTASLCTIGRSESPNVSLDGSVLSAMQTLVTNTDRSSLHRDDQEVNTELKFSEYDQHVYFDLSFERDDNQYEGLARSEETELKLPVDSTQSSLELSPPNVCSPEISNFNPKRTHRGRSLDSMQTSYGERSLDSRLTLPRPTIGTGKYGERSFEFGSLSKDFSTGSPSGRKDFNIPSSPQSAPACFQRIVGSPGTLTVSPKRVKYSAKSVPGQPPRHHLADLIKEDIYFANLNRILEDFPGWCPRERERTVECTMKSVCGEDGYYMLWYSINSKKLVLTVSHLRTVIHYAVHSKVINNQLCYYIFSDYMTHDLVKLIDHHHRNGLAPQSTQEQQERLLASEGDFLALRNHRHSRIKARLSHVKLRCPLKVDYSGRRRSGVELID